MTRVGPHEAKMQLSKLVERAQGGEEILIARRGKPAARLVPAQKGDGFGSLAGTWRGQVRTSEDFDELLPEFAKSLGSES
jgi:prevent-host-death family protein